MYHEEGRELKIRWEMSGSPECDILVCGSDFTRWANTPCEPISEEKQLALLVGFRRWLSEQKLRSDVDLPFDLSEEAARCAWLGCDGRKLHASAYCRRHFDLNCLGR